MKRFCGAVLLALATASCTVGPNYRVPPHATANAPGANGAFVNGGETAFAAAPLPDHWWRLYDDPRLDGYVTNLSLRPGDYLGAGVEALAMIDLDSIRIEAYLEETKLRHVEIGDQARIRLMGDEQDLSGHVESIAGGIADDQRSNSPNLLPAVNATFTWVRLAQRIPVRIHVDRMPPGTRLILGRTATVSILPSNPRKDLAARGTPP